MCYEIHNSIYPIIVYLESCNQPHLMATILCGPTQQGISAGNILHVVVALEENNVVQQRLSNRNVIGLLSVLDQIIVKAKWNVI